MREVNPETFFRFCRGWWSPRVHPGTSLRSTSTKGRRQGRGHDDPRGDGVEEGLRGGGSDSSDTGVEGKVVRVPRVCTSL